jgi:hypothetical protein
VAELGKLISAFVEERVDGPLKGEEELWQEAVLEVCSVLPLWPQCVFLMHTRAPNHSNRQ